MKMFWHQIMVIAHNIVNTLKATELYTSKWLIICYVNFISIKKAPWQYRLTILKPLYMYSRNEHLSKQIVNGGSQVSDCQSGRLQTGKSGEGWNVVMDSHLRYQYELMFSLDTDSYIQKYLQICIYGISIHTYISLRCQLSKPRSNSTPVARSTPNTKIPVTTIFLQ